MEPKFGPGGKNLKILTIFDPPGDPGFGPPRGPQKSVRGAKIRPGAEKIFSGLRTPAGPPRDPPGDPPGTPPDPPAPAGPATQNPAGAHLPRALRATVGCREPPGENLSPPRGRVPPGGWGARKKNPEDFDFRCGAALAMVRGSVPAGRARAARGRGTSGDPESLGGSVRSRTSETLSPNECDGDETNERQSLGRG